MQDELAVAMLYRGDSGLVFDGGSTERGELALLPRFGVFIDRWVVLVEGALFLDERCRDPLLREVDDVCRG